MKRKGDACAGRVDNKQERQIGELRHDIFKLIVVPLAAVGCKEFHPLRLHFGF
jgi:hypothetical protein